MADQSNVNSMLLQCEKTPVSGYPSVRSLWTLSEHYVQWHISPVSSVGYSSVRSLRCQVTTVVEHSNQYLCILLFQLFISEYFYSVWILDQTWYTVFSRYLLYTRHSEQLSYIRELYHCPGLFLLLQSCWKITRMPMRNKIF